MSDPGRPQSPKKGVDGQKGRLGSLKSSFLHPNDRPAAQRMAAGDGSALRPMMIKTEDGATNGQAPGPQAAGKQPAKKRHFAPNLSKAQPRSAPLAAVKPPPDGEESTGLSAPQIQQQQQQQQHHMSEEHKELLRQAELDALWARGGKKGPHSAAGRPKQPGFRAEVEGDMLHEQVAVAPKAVRAPARDPRTPAASTSKGGAGASRTKVKKEPEEDAPMEEEGALEDDEGDEDEPRSSSAARSMFDMRQYYPTLLPLRRPGAAVADEEEAAAAHADARAADLDTMPEEDANVAESLGLLELTDAEERRCVLLQLPALLPATHPPHEDGGGGTGGAGGGAGSGHGGKGKARREGAPHAAAGHGACSLRDLPSGKIGRLLVYESGAVRLALGDVLLELHAGTAAELRQDVALIDAGAKQAVWLLADGVHARGVACPDMDHLLGDAPVPQGPGGQQRRRQEKLRQVLDSDDEMQEAATEEVVVKDEDG